MPRSSAIPPTLMTVINDILDFSRLEADRLELDETDFELEPLVQSVCDAMAPHAFGKGLEIGFYFAPDVPSAACRRRRPHPPGAVQPRRQCDQIHRKGRRGDLGGAGRAVAAAQPSGGRHRFLLRFDIADTGVGIPESVLPSLFEQFAQADPTVARRYGGSGLGLSISRKLAALMGGTIGVASEEGQGSQFWFTAALAPAEGARTAPPAPRLDRRRILFVGDNPVSQEIMAQQLAAWGAVLDTLDEPDRVLPLLRQAAASGRGYAAAILDHETPGLDPLALARAIAAEPELAGIRLVLATSPTASELRHAARDAGFAAVLIKPAPPSAIRAALDPAAAEAPTAQPERRSAEAARRGAAGAGRRGQQGQPGRRRQAVAETRLPGRRRR